MYEQKLSMIDENLKLAIECFGRHVAGAAEKLFESGVTEFEIGYIFGHSPLGIYLYSALQLYKKKQSEHHES